MGSLDELLKKLWDDYAAINKQADGIFKLLTKRGEKVVNDHIAFRTFNIPKIGINVLAKPFLGFGYKPKDQYEFPDKKLHAQHFEHPEPGRPKVFISELKTQDFSKELQATVKSIVEQIPESALKRWDFPISGVLWKKISWKTYEDLKKESEYAAWVAVFGFRANHFTVLFNALKSFKTLEEFNAFIKSSGYPLNASGGEIKGSIKEYLEQSSTMADPVEVEFSDGKKKVPSCYYEFARRYPLPNGKLFHGFVAKSADKIFESTDNK